MGKFEISKRKNNEFQFVLKARNGEVILTSEGYKAKESCKKGIESVVKNGVLENKFEKKTATNGKFYFNLKATNGQVIGTSQMYATDATRQTGIESVKKNVSDAETIDNTSV